jgi:putative ABC transport system permease protein
MASLIRQCIAVTTLNLKSLPQRWSMSVSSVVAVAVAVAVLLGFLSLSNGFYATLSGSGAEDVAIVTSEGAVSEIGSGLSSERVRALARAPHVRSRDGQRLISPELLTIIDGTKKGGVRANVPLRGMLPEGIAIRHEVRLAQGRMFAEGSDEVVVGAGLAREFIGYEVGQRIRLGDEAWTVVGIFEAPGSVFESEVWADARVVQAFFSRGDSYSIARVALDSAQNFNAFKAAVEADPELEVTVHTERDFYKAQAYRTVDIIRFIGWPLGLTMAIGALAGALNATYNSVWSRAAEIATLRIIGFGGFAAFVGTLIESLLLSIMGGLVGVVMCFIFFNGVTASTLGQGATQIVFRMSLSPALALQGMTLAVVIGLVGGWFPGIRAARQNPLVELTGQ